MRRVLVGTFLPAVILLSALCVRAELTRYEKQLALDHHNFLRSGEGASNMRQMQWDELLAKTAQEYADNCFFRPNPVVTIPNHPSLGRVRKGENLYIGEDVESAIQSWYDEGGSSHTQLVWADTYLLGCGAANCPKLSFTGSFTSGTLIVCNYLPSYISGSEAFKSGTCSSSSCPVDASICSNGLCAPSNEPPQVPEDEIEISVDRKVWYFTPNIGSLSGGTRITIYGEGFSSNQFEGRNEVFLTNGDFDVPCDVISYYSNTNPTGNDQIVCDTRSSPDGMDGTYELIVRVDDGKGLEETEPCLYGSCTFRYHRNFWTPRLEEIDPVAMPAGELGLLFFSGRFYTALFQEDLDNSGLEYFTRLLVGGLPCDPMDENGTLYGAVMTSSSRSDIICQPSADNIIDSMNVTAILAIRGSSFVELDEYLLTLDNKLRPYTFQTYAEIVQVSPSAGSVMGGTRISVTLNILVTNYTDNDVEVYVGGVPCEDVMLVPPNMVECTTGPQPPPNTYYPGGRGLLREVWMSESNSFSDLNLDDTDLRPRSELTSVQERLYRDNSHTREFGERFYFTQRYSGFFIPPLTCLYTFSILSDDLCRLYLSPNNSADHKELIASSPEWTRNIWDYWPSQTSEPVYLEEGKPYYIEATNNQGAGPWALGVGAKIHCLDHTTYPYDGDREIQRINISSIVVKEQHEIILGALPAVQKILITYGSFAQQQQEDLMEAEICFDIGDDDLVSFYPDYSSEYIENMLNEVESIKDIGYVKVVKEEVESYGFYFTVIFLSRFGITESEIPLLSISNNSSSPFCNQTLYDVTIEKTQDLTIPESFNLGFNDTYPPRYTSYLPYNVTLDTLRSEITDLFAWECEVSSSPSSLLFQESYEEDDESETRDNSTSFCGHYSAKNPTTIWANQNNPINIVVYKELCFAYWGLPPALKASIDYFDSDSRAPENADIDLSNCVDNWPTTTQHPNWQYTCIDISLCFTREQGSQLLPHMTLLAFDGTGNDFWIDEVSISFSEVSVTQVPPGPAQPGGVSVNYIEVQGGVFDMAELQNRSSDDFLSYASGYGSGSGTHFHDRDPEYVMTLGTYTITYNVHDCGSGMPPLTGYLMVDGYEPESVKIDVEQTALGSALVEGTFELSFGGRSIRNIRADISNSDLEVLLEANFRDEGGFSVTRTGTCAGYKWDVEWERKGGDISSMEASGAGLRGSDPEIFVETVLDGGVWIRPLRADMLRVPKDDPQVEVIVNDIPSSCDDGVCTFDFTSDATPQVFDLDPYEGQGGTPIAIYGYGFTNDTSKITVTIGNSNCYVTEANESNILCTAADHPAGFYQVSVHIEGVGYADINESLCFHYLLSVDSVTPDSGSIGGGQTVIISGNGFLDFAPLEAEELRDPLDILPWFTPGFGIPSSSNFDALCPFLNDLFNLTDFGDGFDFVDEDSDKDMYQSYSHNDFNETTSNHTFNRTDSMPDFEGSFDIEEFYSILELIYSTFPSMVLIGEFPCIVVSSSLTTIECTTIPHLPARVNVTVMVLGERASLRNAYEYSVNDSAIVSSVSPISGPSYGGTSLQITGTNFLSDDPNNGLYIQVQIGNSNCNITSANDTHIECVTQPHSPGYESILITTANGIAVWELSLLAQNITLGKYFESDIGSGGFTGQDFPLFPLYEYQFYVFSIAPLLGSVFGGTTLQVCGIGFENGVTEVYIGDNLCDNRFVNGTLIECVTPSSSKVHMVYFVNDTGFDPDEGYLFSWSETDLNISVGDTVYWEWTLNLQGFQVNVFQTPDNSQSTPLQGGFSSNSSTSGTFSYTFSEPGVHYYASELNPTIILRGEINVGGIQSSTADIQVVDSVNGFKADYIFLTDTDDGSGIVDPFFNSDKEYYDSYKDSLAPDDNPQPMNCTGDSPVYDQYYGSHFPAFMYAVCATPVVYSITPKEGTLGTEFTMEGIGFSSESTVRFGDHECTVTNSTSTVIQCEIDSYSTPPTFVELPLAVNVRGLGNAYVEYPSSMVITLSPIITNIAPNNGSVAGGTGVVITAWGIPEEYDIDVLIGTYPCAIVSVNYTEIQCTTQPAASAGEHPLTVLINGLGTVECGIAAGCTFEYSDETTPVVTNVSPTTLQGPGTIMLDINGTGFSTIPYNNKIYIGEYPCSPIQSTSDYIQCEMEPIPAGTYELSLMICTEPPPESFDDSVQCYGNASIMVPPLQSAGNVTSVSPQSGSELGGTMLTISGLGFESDTSLISVSIGGNPCTVTGADYSTIYCTTVVPTAAGTFPINVVSNGIDFPGNVEFTYDVIPLVISIFPPSGQEGEMVTFSGSGFGVNPFDTVIMIGDSACGVDSSSSNDTSLQCLLGGNFVGYYPVNINVGGIGDADTSAVDDFFYILRLDDFSPKSGSLAGLNSLTVTGLGLNPNFITITICDAICELTVSVPTLTEIECVVPPMSVLDVDNDGEINCNITIESLSESETFEDMYVYTSVQTPVVNSINRTRGGTQGGSRILLTGEGFTGDANVTIAGVECLILEKTETSIVCDTGASGRTVRENVLVYIKDKGYARSEGIEFWYVDLWSSRFTWGGEPLPEEGDFVVIPRGQTLILDTITPVLGYLLIQGGELIFDDEQEDHMVQLHTQGALITEGGRLQIGTEDEPFLHKTRMVLYGHVLSTEIPIYGAKTLALREGEIDMHGRPLDVTWTRLSQTANPGDTTLHLQEAVDWEVGGKIVIASTSYSQRENEELEITEISNSGYTLTISPALEYEHISIQQEIEGRSIDTSAEVGYLTRNVLVRGNLNEEWEERVEGCNEEFRPGQFDIQTCFLGRFGAENINDQFGSQIMIHAAEPNKGDVVGRFEYIEVTHAGQAFRLGRYPIHYHLNGNVSTSYVRGCAIHHTFNRAVTIHAVDYLLVEKNVAYNILGHAYFLEDGIEEHNIIQDNLGIFIRGSSSLLNVDITPATFWIVNPNNIVRRNAAAGGTHFGYWYRLPEHPTGPSETSSVCPRKLPVEEFSNNTAHSFGWYGLWVMPRYDPRLGGGCDDVIHTPAVFSSLLAWKNDRGIEFTEAGSLQVKDSILLDNRLAGVEVTILEAEWGENGPLIQDTLIVGHSELSISNTDICTESGVRTPHTYYLTVSGVSFVNFDRPGCFPIQACSECKFLQGGFETRYENIKFINSPQITKWQWEHEHVHRFLDDSLPGTTGPSSLIPTSEILPTSSCQLYAASSNAEVNGSICDGSIEFGRFAVFDPIPTSIQFSDLHVSNEYGTTVLPYKAKQLLTGPGHMAIVELNQTFQLEWPSGTQFTNISYSELISGFGSDDYIILSQTFPRSLDFISLNGDQTNENATIFDDPSKASTGDWYINDNNTLSYIIKGTSDPPINDLLQFSTYRCLYEDCIVPPPPTLAPPGRPEVFVQWSNVSIWPDERLPERGEDVYINCSLHVVVDVELPPFGTITICGGMELDDTMEHVIEADIILLQGGSLIAGYPDVPFENRARFVLNGNIGSPEVHLNQGPTLGAKAIGVFGELILHGLPPEKTWTRLEETATAGSDTIRVVDSVDWKEGDRIVITSTSFEAKQSEVFEIVEVSNNEITLDGSLMFDHIVDSGNQFSLSYSISAEVGLLTRNIVIENGQSDVADEETFGCRVLVGSYFDDQFFYSGSAQINGVEFSGCGQRGYTESFDPRFSLAFLTIGAQGYASYVTNSSFHDGYNTAIGVFGTHEILLDNNVIHVTVGPSIQVTGLGHNVTNNLASFAQFPGTYRDTNEPLNFEWTANFEVVEAERLKLVGNVAAGGGKAGFHTNGEACEAEAGTGDEITGNVAHSTLHGIHMGYEDGHPSGCSKLSGFTIFNCYHYAIFAYSQAGIWITDTALVNNYAGVYISVIGPNALTHIVGDKQVLIENSIIISASEQHDCAQDDIVPEISEHETSYRGIRSSTGGHVGIVIPSFVSGKGHFPKEAWFSIISYPAISGLTTIRNVGFDNFAQRCGNQKDVVLITNARSEDCNHPVHFENIAMLRTEAESKFFNHEPHLSSVNPSDCVDMDCDGLKHVLIKDLDGSFTESTGPRSLISMAENEWDGMPQRGIGDYRIPRTMLTLTNGSRVEADEVYPSKGALRGTESGDGSQCTFNSIWNAYECSELDHLMLVMESLDADTEVRRLSPIGLGANGFIDLLNGPQDNGWCGGYTCQERISTFYGIVAAGYEYAIGLTSTNPQKMALHLLNSNSDQAIVVGIIYTNPQRLDIYYEGGYVTPKNAEQQSDGNLIYEQKDPDNPREFVPLTSDEPGANYYDRDEKKLYITIKGSSPIEIRTQPVIQVSLELSVSTTDFFNPERLVENLAFLLGIPPNKIRVVNVVRETISRRKRQTGSDTVMVDFEIGNTPTNGTNATSSDGQNATETDVDLTAEALEMLTPVLVQTIQTGEILENVSDTAAVESATLQEAEPPPVDPTNGVRATPATGGPQPDNVTNSSIPTFYEMQLMEERAEVNETATITLSVPTELVIIRQPNGTTEGLPFPQPPLVVMHDNNGEVVENLGFGDPWILTATIETGPEGAYSTEASVNMTNGIANFTKLILSHPGSYVLTFTITYPLDVDISAITSEAFGVEQRSLQLLISREPTDGNTSRALYPYPTVNLLDPETNRIVTDHGWRNRTWYISASIDIINVLTTEEVSDGEAKFTDIIVPEAGRYQIVFTALTDPVSPPQELPVSVTSDPFEIIQRPFTRVVVVYDEDFATIIPAGQEEDFIQAFRLNILQLYNYLEVYNITLSNGSIIVSFFATANTADELATFVDEVTSDNDTLAFIFRNTLLTPISITQDSNYPVVFPTQAPSEEDELVLILSAAIPGGTILLLTIVVIIIVLICQRHKKKTKVFKITVKPAAPNLELEERYVEHRAQHFSDTQSMESYYLLHDNKLKDLESQSVEEHEMSEMNSKQPVEVEIVVSKEINVPATTSSGMMFTNPTAISAIGGLDLDDSFEEILGSSAENSNNNNNNNNDNLKVVLPNVVPDTKSVMKKALSSSPIHQSRGPRNLGDLKIESYDSTSL